MHGIASSSPDFPQLSSDPSAFREVLPSQPALGTHPSLPSEFVLRVLEELRRARDLEAHQQRASYVGSVSACSSGHPRIQHLPSDL